MSSFVKAGGVNWNAYDTNGIWQMLKNENVCTGQDRVLAWQTISEALASQHAGLTAAREALAAAWPPEKNDSARIFLQKIDFMLSSISDTMTKATDTRIGLNGILDRIAEAQAEVRAKVGDRLDAADDLIPRMIDDAEDEIDEEVRQIMRTKEAEISQSSANIKVATIFVLNAGEGGGRTGVINSSDGEPFGTDSVGNSTHGGLRATTRPVDVPHDPPAPRPGHDPTLPGDDGGPHFPGDNVADGPTLERGGPTTLPRTSGEVGLLPVQPGTDLFLQGLAIGASGATVIGTSVDRGMGGMPVDSGVRQTVGVRNAMASGSVIGGGSPIGGNPMGGAGGRGVSPGVIGSANGRSTAGGTGVGANANGMPGMNGAGGRGRQHEEDQDNGDPTNPWETDEGVPPVIDSDRRVYRHDVGMNVIGWGR